MKMAIDTIIGYFKSKSRLAIAAILLIALGEWSRRHNSWTSLNEEAAGKSYRANDSGVDPNENHGRHALNDTYIVGGGDEAEYRSQQDLQKYKHPAPGFPSSYFSEGSCWRTCPEGKRQNHIVFSFMNERDLEHHSHLADRAWELHALANLAGYMCATLHIPSPSLWMKTIMENHHNITNSEDDDAALEIASWYDLYNLTFLADGETGILEYDSWDRVPSLDQDSRHSVVHTTQEELIVRDFEYVEALSFPASWDTNLRHTFVWDLDISWWKAQHHLAHLLQHRKQSENVKWIETGDMLPQIEREKLAEKGVGKDGCEYVNVGAPVNRGEANFTELVDEIWGYIRQRTDSQITTLGLLDIAHINKRHKKGHRKPCEDTSAERMAGYLECSFNNTTAQDMTLVMATSMRNYALEDFSERVQYHLEIQEVLPSNVKVLDLNDILEQCLHVKLRTSPSIAYFKRQYPAVVLLNRLVEALREDSRIKFRLEQRGGGHCQDCTSVQHQLHD